MLESVRIILADFACGSLPIIGAALGILAIFLIPLMWVTRSLGVW